MKSKKKSWLVTADKDEIKLYGFFAIIPMTLISIALLSYIIDNISVPHSVIGILFFLSFILNFLVPQILLSVAQKNAIKKYKSTFSYKIETLLHELHIFSTKNAELKKSIHSIVEFTNFLIEYANNHDLASDSFEKIIHLHLQMAFDALSLYQSISHSPLRTGTEEQDVLTRLENVKTALQERAKSIVSDAELSLNASISAFNEVSKIH